LPEILEVEAARKVLETRALDREIASVYAPDLWFLKRGATPMTLSGALVGNHFIEARRRGKLLLLDTDGPTIGVHLGMSGRVLVDDEEAGDPLVYASNRRVPKWHRFGVHFADGGDFFLRDPRRLGGVAIDPDESRLGPDALTLSLVQFEHALDARVAPIKAILMDQSRIAGLGNLLVDEVLWRSGIDPTRPAVDIPVDERKVLHRAIRDTLRVLGRRGGSHTGDMPRDVNTPCPRDGAPMVRRTVAGRTTYSCSRHQGAVSATTPARSRGR
jgi:formamidopyrimidine-DNA glycosylase